MTPPLQNSGSAPAIRCQFDQVVTRDPFCPSSLNNQAQATWRKYSGGYLSFGLNVTYPS